MFIFYSSALTLDYPWKIQNNKTNRIKHSKFPSIDIVLHYTINNRNCPWSMPKWASSSEFDAELLVGGEAAAGGKGAGAESAHHLVYAIEESVHFRADKVDIILLEH